MMMSTGTVDLPQGVKGVVEKLTKTCPLENGEKSFYTVQETRLDPVSFFEEEKEQGRFDIVKDSTRFPCAEKAYNGDKN